MTWQGRDRESLSIPYVLTGANENKSMGMDVSKIPDDQ